MRVIAPTRLHFGLFHVPVPGAPGERKFGGLGLMLDEPTVSVEVEPAAAWSATGSLAARALGFAKAMRSEPVRLVAEGPPEHVGLGVGTALGLSVARALAMLDGGAPDVQELARRAGRGSRSGIGLHGFARGGFLVDGGKLGDEAPTLEHRFEFPSAWRVVLLRPKVEPAWHGERERHAFARPRDAALARATTTRLRKLAGAIGPALVRADFAAFVEHLHEFNRVAGEPFAAEQGGPYAGAPVANLVARLQACGAVGVGQSSWGPTVFAMAPDGEFATALAQRAAAWDLAEVHITRGSNVGARADDE